ncbi:MAG: SigE family RNA polymerase sigma factor [Actinomycetota bacterium]
MEGYDGFLAARGPALLRTAYLICGDRHQAEDLFQNAMARLLVHWPRVHQDNPEAYARRILVNSTINWRQRLQARETVVPVVPDETSADFTDAHAARDEVWQALARLPLRQRAVLVLRYYEDLTEAQTAELLRCSVGTVKSQHAKALERLRSEPSRFGRPSNDNPSRATTIG